MAADNHTTIVGNLVDDPELRFTNNGIAVANMRVAVTQRVQQDGEWRDGENVNEKWPHRARQKWPHLPVVVSKSLVGATTERGHWDGGQVGGSLIARRLPSWPSGSPAAGRTGCRSRRSGR
jgi:hypothetical protein